LAQDLATTITRILAEHLQSDPGFRPTLETQIAFGRSRDEIAALLEAYLPARERGYRALDRIIQTVRDAAR
jgi:hypothetical protein